MKLYMIRHGESAANEGRLHAGWTQTPLTDKGFEHARQAGRVLSGLHFDRVYCSDLLRAMQTQQTALPDAQAEISPLLREISVGSLAGKNAAACLAEYGPDYLKNKADFNFTPYGGEALSMHQDRVRRFLALLLQRQDARVAAFCHAGTIRCMLDLTLGARHDRAAFSCGNGSVSVFEEENGRWRVSAWNITVTP